MTDQPRSTPSGRLDRASGPAQRRVSPGGYWAGLVLLVALGTGGCWTPPRGPGFQEIPLAFPKDRRVQAEEPIRSAWLEQAALAAAQSPDPSLGNWAGLLETGEDALVARLHLIRAARQTVEIQTFIWTDDAASRLVWEELRRAARRGVQVRVLVDQLVPLSPDPRVLAAFAADHENLQWKLYHPLFRFGINDWRDFLLGLLFRSGSLNYRMHNKVFLVDGQVGIVGGRNYQDCYFDWDADFNFRDREVCLGGSLVAVMRQSFERFWDHPLAVDALALADVKAVLQREGLPVPPPPSPPPDPSAPAEVSARAEACDLSASCPSFRPQPVAEARFLSDPPVKPTWRERRRGFDPWREVRELLEETRHELLIQTPYLVMERRLVRQFRRLRERAPWLPIAVSTNSLASADHAAVAAVSFKQRKLHWKTLRIDIYQYQPRPAVMAELAPRLFRGGAPPPDTEAWLEQGGAAAAVFQPLPVPADGSRFCIHAKSLVADGQVAMIGSHNFDPRSEFWNTECALIIRDREFAGQLAASIRRDMEPGNSWVVGKKREVPVISYFSGILGSISLMLPVFDIWPFTYTSCYELLEGREPVSPRDPRFYDRYRDVGDFPGVELPLELIQARLLKAFAGWAAPFL